MIIFAIPFGSYRIIKYSARSLKVGQQYIVVELTLTLTEYHYYDYYQYYCYYHNYVIIVNPPMYAPKKMIITSSILFGKHYPIRPIGIAGGIVQLTYTFLGSGISPFPPFSLLTFGAQNWFKILRKKKSITVGKHFLKKKVLGTVLK